ncbi:MAG: hypothetical protein OJF59_002856 [Cytophagales bacterium]|nr:MAG: hypothetical protein OJF59_002856 [Cytophagales bacterium]
MGDPTHFYALKKNSKMSNVAKISVTGVIKKACYGWFIIYPVKQQKSLTQG